MIANHLPIVCINLVMLSINNNILIINLIPLIFFVKKKKVALQNDFSGMIRII